MIRLRRKDTPIVKLVKTAEYAEYVIRRDDRLFINSLSDVGHPPYNQKPDIAFEMNGNEMSVGEVGIKHKDTLFAKKINQSHLKEKLSKVVVVVLQSEIIIRRLHHWSQTFITLKADDENYEPKEVSLEQVVDLFEIIGISTTYLPTPSKTEDRLAKIEAQLKQLTS